MQIFQTFHKL